MHSTESGTELHNSPPIPIQWRPRPAGRWKTALKKKGLKKGSKAESQRTSSRVDRLIQKGISDTWKHVTKYPSSVYFMIPVDPVELEIPDYLEIIKEPMDLGTVKAKADKGEYSSFDEFAYDMRLTFKNAYTYNTDETYPIVIAARELESTFNGLIKNAERMLKINTEKKDMAEVGSDAEFDDDDDDDDDEEEGDEDEEAEFSDGAQDKRRRPKRVGERNGGKKSKGGKKDKKSKKKGKSEPEPVEAEDEEMDESDDAASGDDFEYQVQHVLGSRSMTAAEWRDVCEKMNTREVTRGSVWKQPDEEYFDESKLPVPKYLIKWIHASFLHVSWETEKDLVDIVGQSAKQALRRYHERVASRKDLFEDMGKGEYYLPSFVTVERLLDIDDDTVNLQKVNWQSGELPKCAPLPEPKDDEERAERETRLVLSVDEGEDELGYISESDLLDVMPADPHSEVVHHPLIEAEDEMVFDIVDENSREAVPVAAATDEAEAEAGAGPMEEEKEEELQFGDDLFDSDDENAAPAARSPLRSLSRAKVGTDSANVGALGSPAAIKAVLGLGGLGEDQGMGEVAPHLLSPGADAKKAITRSSRSSSSSNGKDSSSAPKEEEKNEKEEEPLPD